VESSRRVRGPPRRPTRPSGHTGAAEPRRPSQAPAALRTGAHRDQRNLHLSRAFDATTHRASRRRLGSRVSGLGSEDFLGSAEGARQRFGLDVPATRCALRVHGEWVGRFGRRGVGQRVLGSEIDGCAHGRLGIGARSRLTVGPGLGPVLCDSERARAVRRGEAVRQGGARGALPRPRVANLFACFAPVSLILGPFPRPLPRRGACLALGSVAQCWIGGCTASAQPRSRS